MKIHKDKISYNLQQFDRPVCAVNIINERLLIVLASDELYIYKGERAYHILETNYLNPEGFANPEEFGVAFTNWGKHNK